MNDVYREDSNKRNQAASEILKRLYLVKF